MSGRNVVWLSPTGFRRANVVRQHLVDHCRSLGLSDTEQQRAKSAALRCLTNGASAHAALHAGLALASSLRRRPTRGDAA